jgi:hypothetical protein
MATWFIRDLDRNVKLTDEQKAQLADLLEKMRQEAIDQFRSNPPSAQARQTYRALRQQLQEAAAAGQDERVEEIQRQLDGMAGASVFRQMRTRSLEEVAKILNPDQKRAFEEWRSLQQSPLPAFLLADPDTLESTIDSIPTLSDAQKNAVDAAVQRYRRQVDVLGSEDPVTLNSVRNRLACEIQQILRPGQQVLLTSGWRQQMRARNATRPAGRRGGYMQRRGVPPVGESGLPGRQEIDPQDVDAWTAYVQTFIARYSLDAGQQATSYSILKELRARAAEYMSSHSTDLEYLNQQSLQAASPQERVSIDQDRKALAQPVADLFQELKDRLELLLTAVQRAAASRPSMPRSTPTVRSTGQGRVPSTQSAAMPRR